MIAAPEVLELEAQSIEDIAAATALSRADLARWPEMLVRLVRVIGGTLRAGGIDAERAEELARRVVAAMATDAGGKVLYLPRGDALKTALIHDAIYRASRRGNGEALAAQYGYTLRHVERIVARQTALHRARIQPPLPLPEP